MIIHKNRSIQIRKTIHKFNYSQNGQNIIKLILEIKTILDCVNLAYQNLYT